METNGKSIKNIMKGVGISLLTTIICLVIFSAILTYTNVSENVINPVIMILTGISILIGSSISSIKIKRNGILNGAIIGLVYMILIYLISSTLNWKFGLNMQAILLIIIGIFFGIIGGIIGVNRK